MPRSSAAQVTLNPSATPTPKENSCRNIFARAPLSMPATAPPVANGICTHLGCSPSTAFTPGDPALGADWPGGFLCPCHGSTFDFAGRVFKNKPAPTNLEVPPHQFLSDSRLIIGSDELTPT